MSKDEKKAYLRVLCFAIAAFIFNTTEFIPVALLSDIGKGFDMPVSQVGWMMTAYAWTVTIMSLPLMLFTAKMERRQLLGVLFLIFIVGHALSFFAWNFEVLLGARIVIALAHAVFWAITSSLVMRVAPKGKATQALGWMSMGSAMAAVLGLPLGRMIGQWLGWRATFGLIGLVALCVMILMMKWLPRLESSNAGSLKSVPQLLKRPLLLGVYALTAIMICAHFTAYSYIEPFVVNITHMNAGLVTAILLIFGASGFVASWLFGQFYNARPTQFLIGAAMVLLVSLLGLNVVGHIQAAMFALVFVWGIGISCLSLSMVSRVLSLAPDATDVATAIYSGIYNIGIGGGALLGGIMMRQMGLPAIGWTGALLAVMGLSLFIWVNKRYAV